VKSALRGRRTSAVEVTNVSGRGFSLTLDGRTLFLALEQFPFFRDATIGQLCNVQRPHAGHLHWPDLDVDLSEDSIERPDLFPLVSRARVNGRGQARRKLARRATKRGRKRG
jgi:hypothetical protein